MVVGSPSIMDRNPHKEAECVFQQLKLQLDLGENHGNCKKTRSQESCTRQESCC
jgi:hypothetical protein